MPSTSDLTLIALGVGPFFMTMGFIILGYELHRSTIEMHSHVMRIQDRDARWNPIIVEVQQNTIDIKKNADNIAASLKEGRTVNPDIAKIIEKQDELARLQVDLLSAVKELIQSIKHKQIFSHL